MNHFNKILIVGSTCTGKTTTAINISKILNIDYFELDEVYWKENWVQNNITEFRNTVYQISEQEKWIIDSVYLNVYSDLYEKADIIIWLDINFLKCFSQILKRCIKRSFQGTILFNNNKETFSRNFLNINSVILALILDFNKHKKCYSFDPWKKVLKLSNYGQINKWIFEIENNTAPNSSVTKWRVQC